MHDRRRRSSPPDPAWLPPPTPRGSSPRLFRGQRRRAERSNPDHLEKPEARTRGEPRQQRRPRAVTLAAKYARGRPMSGNESRRRAARKLTRSVRSPREPARQVRRATAKKLRGPARGETIGLPIPQKTRRADGWRPTPEHERATGSRLPRPGSLRWHDPPVQVQEAHGRTITPARSSQGAVPQLLSSHRPPKSPRRGYREPRTQPDELER